MGIPRKFMHLGGLILILLAQFIGGLNVSLIFFLVTIMLIIYSKFSEKEGFSGFVEDVGERIMKFAFGPERYSDPIISAFWLYFSLGLAFLVFPLNIATACGIILSVGDSLSTLVGLRYGKHKIFGNKSLEGSIAFFLSGFLLTAFFLGSLIAFLGSISATLIELIPEAERIKNWRKRELVDDNWLVPLLSGLIMYVAYVLVASA